MVVSHLSPDFLLPQNRHVSRLGMVRIAVLLRVKDEAVRLAVITKLGWIKRQQGKFAEPLVVDVRLILYIAEINLQRIHIFELLPHYPIVLPQKHARFLDQSLQPLHILRQGEACA